MKMWAFYLVSLEKGCHLVLLKAFYLEHLSLLLSTDAAWLADCSQLFLFWLSGIFSF